LNLYSIFKTTYGFWIDNFNTTLIIKPFIENQANECILPKIKIKLKPSFSLHTSPNKNSTSLFQGFVFQFCDVAKMTIIHKKKNFSQIWLHSRYEKIKKLKDL